MSTPTPTAHVYYLHSKIRAAVCSITAFAAKPRPIWEKRGAALTPRVACQGVVNTDSRAGMGGGGGGGGPGGGGGGGGARAIPVS